MAAVDIYLNETTRHAHIILPPTAALEHDHFDLVFNLLAVRNIARYSPAIFQCGRDARHDWQILSELDRRFHRGSAKARLRSWLNARLGPRRMLDLGLRSGPYGSGLNVFGRGLNLKRLERQVHGADLGPLETCLPARLRTRQRRISVAPAPFIDDVRRLHTFVKESANRESLLLIGRRDVRSNNSWMHNSRRLVKGRDRCTLLVHPTDADRLGIATEVRVEVVSRIGCLEVPLELSDEVMPGVVSLPHGWGHHRPDMRIAIAERHPGVSANDLTDEEAVDELSGNAVLNGVPVQVRKIGSS
jgi:anaerobic selenocysteine-containing dehydrogenase